MKMQMWILRTYYEKKVSEIMREQIERKVVNRNAMS